MIHKRGITPANHLQWYENSSIVKAMRYRKEIAIRDRRKKFKYNKVKTQLKLFESLFFLYCNPTNKLHCAPVKIQKKYQIIQFITNLITNIADIDPLPKRDNLCKKKLQTFLEEDRACQSTRSGSKTVKIWLTASWR